MPEDFDLTITGAGIYTIRARNERAVCWLDTVAESDAGTFRSEDARLIVDIAEEAMGDGLIVGFNGKLYLGDSHAA